MEETWLEGSLVFLSLDKKFTKITVWSLSFMDTISAFSFLCTSSSFVVFFSLSVTYLSPIPSFPPLLPPSPPPLLVLSLCVILLLILDICSTVDTGGLHPPHTHPCSPGHVGRLEKHSSAAARNPCRQNTLSSGFDPPPNGSGGDLNVLDSGDVPSWPSAFSTEGDLIQHKSSQPSVEGRALLNFHRPYALR